MSGLPAGTASTVVSGVAVFADRSKPVFQPLTWNPRLILSPRREGRREGGGSGRTGVGSVITQFLDGPFSAASGSIFATEGSVWRILQD